MATVFIDDRKDEGRELGARMSFLEHLDELRRRLIRSAIYVFAALVLCWFVSDRIYNFLSVPVRRADDNAVCHLDLRRVDVAARAAALVSAWQPRRSDD
jgi:Sec-independent protein secretion pathway component TatC